MDDERKKEWQSALSEIDAMLNEHYQSYESRRRFFNWNYRLCFVAMAGLLVGLVVFGGNLEPSTRWLSLVIGMSGLATFWMLGFLVEFSNLHYGLNVTKIRLDYVDTAIAFEDSRGGEDEV